MLIALVAAVLAAPIQVANINDGNAMTLPAGRHMVRIDPGGGRPVVWLAAIQQDGADGHALGFYRSDDEAQTWSYYAPIQDDPSETDRVDLLAVGNDIALVYSYEGPTISGSALHSVYFQWWRYDGSGGWNPSAPVTVMQAASDSSNGYLRGEIAIDSKSRIWVQAMRIEPSGSFTLCMAVSTNGGASFAMQPTLGSFVNRPGGRILSLGTRLMFLYSTHGVDPGYMRLRNDSDALGTWSSAQQVFPEGIYHGAALSAVGDGNGGVHLVYKDVNERLAYRFFNGSGWGGRTDIEDVQDWATQPATTRIGNDVLVFWNHPVSTNTDYRYRYLLIHNHALGGSITLDDSSGFKGYPAAAELLPVGVPRVPCFYGNTPDANSSGTANVVFGDTPGGGVVPDAGTPDAGTADAGTPDAGTPDAGTPDAGTPDAGTPDAGTPDGGTSGGGGTLFSDTFNRTASTLPATWTVVKGAFIQDTRANADLNAPDQAMVKSFSCADCTVQADVDGFGDPLAIDLRVQASAPDDRYDLALQSTGHVQIRKHRGGVITVLGDVASGIADTGNWSTLTLTASGAGPVSLVAKVNGVVKLGVNDTANVLGAGSAGFSTALAGIWFRNFVVTGASGTGGGGADGGTPDAGTPDAGTPDAGTPDAGTPDAGTPDAGTPDAGTPDAGTPDAGTPDAGTPDAGTPDAGTPDAGTPDAGTPDAGTPDAGTGGPVSFSDSFNRNTSVLGAPWVVVKGAFIDDTRANSDNDAPDQAMVSGLSCGDCTVKADVDGFGDPVAIDLRVQASTPDNRYDLILQNTGHVQIRKHRGGVITVLGDAASGIADTGNWSTLMLTATGSGPVSLVAKVNGNVKLSVTDTSNVLGAGSGGISAWISGIWFRNFSLTGTGGSGGGADGGTGGGSDGGTDGGTGGTDAGSALSMQVTYTGTDYDLMAVDRFGTAYGNQIGDSNSNLYASTDGRSWTFAGTSGNGWDFHVVTALSTGTLLADTMNGDQHVLERSTDHGATWSDVLQTGVYSALSPHSYAELDGAVYYTEYQVFTEGATPIHLWKSVDDGQTWSVVQTFTTHRHGHGLIADPARHALWAVFGDTDPQAGTYRSTDAGKTWTAMATAQPGDIVDGTILPDGSLLAGQDISYQPDLPHVARIGLDKTVTDYVTLPSASYSTHAVSSGGYVVGATREQGADVTPSSVTTGSLWGSGDGVHWARLLDVQEASTVDDCRTDVYWELASGELVVSVKGASGFGADGRGYLLIKTQRH
jgi:hypothetical protein